MIDILKEKQEAEEGQYSGKDMNAGSMMKDAAKHLPSNMRPGSFKMPSMGSYSPSSFPGIPSSLKL